MGIMIRVVSSGVLALCVVGMVWVFFPYLAWVERHNTLYFNAVEVGKLPSYEPGHYLVGWTLGTALAALTALAVLAAVFALAGGLTRDARVNLLVVLTAIAVGALEPASTLSLLYGLPIAVVAVIFAVLTISRATRLVQPRDRADSVAAPKPSHGHRRQHVA